MDNESRQTEKQIQADVEGLKKEIERLEDTIDRQKYQIEDFERERKERSPEHIIMAYALLFASFIIFSESEYPMSTGAKLFFLAVSVFSAGFLMVPGMIWMTAPPKGKVGYWLWLIVPLLLGAMLGAYKTQKEIRAHTVAAQDAAYEYYDMLDWFDADSSAFDRIGYDDTINVLGVEFGGSGVYYYYDVPPEVFDDFLGASSRGSYYQENIKGQYESKRGK